MANTQSPFEVLGISPEAELEVVFAAYKALARKYHPDMNPGVAAGELTAKMVKLNWAKEELERDLAGWRARVASKRMKPSGTPGTTRGRSGEFASSGVAATIEPQVVSLPGRKGARAIFTVAAQGIDQAKIKARFQPGSVDIQRQPASGSSAVFSVTVVEDFPSDVPDSAVETVEIVGPGLMSGKLFVSVTPVSASVLAQEYGGRIAPPRHVSHDARISFGKHRSRTFYEIAVQEPGYLEWMLREGAGSIVERQCAQVALARVRGAFTLTGKRARAARRQLPTRRPAAPLPSLPDPARPKSIWQSLKALVSPKDRS